MNHPALYRPVNNRVMGGVCAGVAQRLNIDPNLVRIAVVVLAFIGGVGVAGYLTGLAVIPRQGSVEPPVSKVFRFTRDWSPALLAAATFVVLMIGFGIANGSFGIGLFPIAVIGVILYLRSKRRQRPRQQLTPEPTPFERSAQAWQQRLAQRQQTLNGYPGTYQPPPTGYPEPSFIQPSAQPQQSPQYAPQSPQSPPTGGRSRVLQAWLIAAGLTSVSWAVFAILQAYAGIYPPFAFITTATTVCLLVGLIWSARTKLSKSLLIATILSGLASIGFLLRAAGTGNWLEWAPFALIAVGIVSLVVALRKH